MTFTLSSDFVEDPNGGSFPGGYDLCGKTPFQKYISDYGASRSASDAISRL